MAVAAHHHFGACAIVGKKEDDGVLKRAHGFDLRQDAAVSFLRDLLPGRAEPAWETAVVGAVDRVLRRSSEPTCLEVVRALEQGDETDAQVGKTLEVYARSGLTQLASGIES